MTLISGQGVPLPLYAQIDDVEPGSFVFATSPGTGLPPPPVVTVSGYIEFATSLTAKLVTSATSAKRSVHADLKDETGAVVLTNYAPITQLLSTTVIYTWMSTVTAAWGVADVGAVMPLFSLPLLPGWKIQIQCDNIQVGDQFSNVRGNSSRFPTGKSVERKSQRKAPSPTVRPVAV